VDSDAPADLADLAALLAETVGLDETLLRIARYAVAAFPAVDGAALRLADDAATAYAGAAAVRMADELHAALGEGPAVDALLSGSVTSSGSLGGDARWRRFGPRVGRLGLHSVLAVPLLLPHDPVGTVTVYSSRKHAFTETDADLAQHYALPAAAVVHNARVLEQSRRRVAQLTEALRVRPQIDRAIGIMMSRSAKSADEAMDALRRMSNLRHVKVADVARELVDEAVRRARHRRITDRADPFVPRVG
jgi:GAF domain-containing protein